MPLKGTWKLHKSAPIRVAYATPNKTANIAAPIAKAKRKPLTSSVVVAMKTAGIRPLNSSLVVVIPGVEEQSRVGAIRLAHMGAFAQIRAKTRSHAH